MHPPNRGKRPFLPSFLLVMLAVGAGAATGTAGEGGGSGVPPGARRVHLRRPAAEAVATAIAGRGIAELPRSAVLSPAGEVVWELVRDETDELDCSTARTMTVAVATPPSGPGADSGEPDASLFCGCELSVTNCSECVYCCHDIAQCQLRWCSRLRFWWTCPEWVQRNFQTRQVQCGADWVCQ